MKTDAPKTKRFPRAVKVLFWLGGALVVYSVVGFLVAPAPVSPSSTGQPRANLSLQ